MKTQTRNHPGGTSAITIFPAGEKCRGNGDIHALASAADARDLHSYGHSRKVSRHASALARAIGLPSEAVKIISKAALLHDIGKISIPEQILRKPRPLSAGERELVRTHPETGADIIRNNSEFSDCLPIIFCHHEHYNGCGYPRRLKGDDIPLEARILTIADAFVTMTSLRPYHAPCSPRAALAEIDNEAGKQFDPRLVPVFLKLNDAIAGRGAS